MTKLRLNILTAILAAAAIAMPLNGADSIVEEEVKDAPGLSKTMGAAGLSSKEEARFIREEARVAQLKHRLTTLQNHDRNPHMLKMVVKDMKHGIRHLTKKVKAVTNNLKAVTKAQKLMKSQISKKKSKVVKLKKALAKAKKGTSTLKAKKLLRTATDRLERKVKDMKGTIVSAKAATQMMKKMQARLKEMQDDLAGFKAEEASTEIAVKYAKAELKLLTKTLKAMKQGRASQAGKHLAAAKHSAESIEREEIRVGMTESKALKATKTTGAHSDNKSMSGALHAVDRSISGLERWAAAQNHEVRHLKTKMNKRKKALTKAERLIKGNYKAAAEYNMRDQSESSRYGH